MAARVSPPLPAALEDRVVAADGAVVTALGPVAAAPDDVAGHEGRGETFPTAGPEAARGYPDAGADAVGTSAAGADPPNPADHGPEQLGIDLIGSTCATAPAGTSAKTTLDGLRPLVEVFGRPSALGPPEPFHPEQSTDAFVAHHPEAKCSNA